MKNHVPTVKDERYEKFDFSLCYVNFSLYGMLSDR